eukprot:tig00021073_g18054.t1
MRNAARASRSGSRDAARAAIALLARLALLAAACGVAPTLPPRDDLLFLLTYARPYVAAAAGPCPCLFEAVLFVPWGSSVSVYLVDDDEYASLFRGGAAEAAAAEAGETYLPEPDNDDLVLAARVFETPVAPAATVGRFGSYVSGPRLAPARDGARFFFVAKPSPGFDIAAIQVAVQIRPVLSLRVPALEGPPVPLPPGLGPAELCPCTAYYDCGPSAGPCPFSVAPRGRADEPLERPGAALFLSGAPSGSRPALLATHLPGSEPCAPEIDLRAALLGTRPGVVLAPTQVPTGGGILALYGAGFGRDVEALEAVLVLPQRGADPEPLALRDDDPRALLDAAVALECRETFFVPDQAGVACTAPPGAGSAAGVALLFRGRPPVLGAFSYEPPRVDSVSEAPEAGGEVVLAGANFGPRGTPVQVRVGGLLCEGARVSRPHVEIRCTAPPGHGARLPLILQVSDQHVTLPVGFSYSPHPIPEGPGPPASARFAAASTCDPEPPPFARFLASLEGWRTLVVGCADSAPLAWAALSPSLAYLPRRALPGDLARALSEEAAPASDPRWAAVAAALALAQGADWLLAVDLASAGPGPFRPPVVLDLHRPAPRLAPLPAPAPWHGLARPPPPASRAPRGPPGDFVRLLDPSSDALPAALQVDAPCACDDSAESDPDAESAAGAPRSFFPAALAGPAFLPDARPAALLVHRAAASGLLWPSAEPSAPRWRALRSAWLQRLAHAAGLRTLLRPCSASPFPPHALNASSSSSSDLDAADRLHARLIANKALSDGADALDAAGWALALLARDGLAHRSAPRLWRAWAADLRRGGLAPPPLRPELEAPPAPPDRPPAVSFVAATRNDGYGGGLRRRFQAHTSSPFPSLCSALI